MKYIGLCIDNTKGRQIELTLGKYYLLRPCRPGNLKAFTCLGDTGHCIVRANRFEIIYCSDNNKLLRLLT